jgi:hypothetical protein
MVRSRLAARAALLGRFLIKGAMVDINLLTRPAGIEATRKTDVRNWLDS